MNYRYMIDFKTYLKLHYKDLTIRIDPDAEVELDLALENPDELPKQPFLLLLPTHIKGYNLRTKSWGKSLP